MAGQRAMRAVVNSMLSRCFVAIDINDSIREKVRTLQAEMRQFHAPVRFPDPVGIHITLKFLGSVDEEMLMRIKESLSRCRPSAVFDLRVGGVGAFPALNSPKVFWVGIESATPLQGLYRCVEAALSWMGISEARPFRPHLTLGRVKGRKGLGPLIDYITIKCENFEAGIVTVRGFHLYRSILKPDGAQYVKLASFSVE
ncbi:MAG: RNA 2',3'-cyclic phosphodiesterase [Acidobacteria bacterium]|nr:RNA 2',3'-cyclic phosphodiesterase [Acidobacteriota bacterium]